MDLIIGLVLLVVLAFSIWLICHTYKFKNAVLRWLFIIIPPLFVIPLYWVPWDLGAVIVWIPAIIAFLWSTLNLVFNVVRIILRKLRKKPQIEYVKVRFVRSVLTISIFLSASFLVSQSLRSADEFAKETAKKIQADSDTNGMCPKRIQGWEIDKWDPNSSVIMYGKYGTKYRLRYRSSENRKEFNISVRHNIDEAFYVSGGVDRKLKATYSGPGNSVDVPIE